MNKVSVKHYIKYPIKGYLVELSNKDKELLKKWGKEGGINENDMEKLLEGIIEAGLILIKTIAINKGKCWWS